MNFVEPIRSKEDVNKIKEAMRADGNFRDLTLFSFGIRTGLRISDLLELKWDEFVNTSELDKLDKTEITSEVLNTLTLPEDSEINVKEQKTGKTKDFWFVDMMRSALLEYLEDLTKSCYNHKYAGKYIFESRTAHFSGAAQPISRSQAWRNLNKYAKKAGVDINMGTHTLRKTFGYFHYSTGTPLPEIQEMLNHSSEAVTLRYIGISKETRKKNYKKGW